MRRVYNSQSQSGCQHPRMLLWRLSIYVYVKRADVRRALIPTTSRLVCARCNDDVRLIVKNNQIPSCLDHFRVSCLPGDTFLLLIAYPVWSRGQLGSSPSYRCPLTFFSQLELGAVHVIKRQQMGSAIISIKPLLSPPKTSLSSLFFAL